MMARRKKMGQILELMDKKNEIVIPEQPEENAIKQIQFNVMPEH